MSRTGSLRFASLLACIVALGGASVAHGDDASVTEILCHSATIDCSVTGDSSVRDATIIDVGVTGAPHTRGSVLVYRAVLDGDRLVALEPMSAPAAFDTGAGGVSNLRVAIPGTGELGREGGWAFLSLAGQGGPDVSGAVGQFVPFAARIPHLLGDGYAKDKPVGKTLELHADGAVPGTSFRVEYLDQEAWQDATAPVPDATVVADRPDGLTVLRYQVPRGLRGDRDYEFRVRNMTDSAVTESWLVRPSAVGTQQARIPQFTPPSVGTNRDPAHRLSLHPQSVVTVTATTVAGVSAAVLIVGTPMVRRRRG